MVLGFISLTLVFSQYYIADICIPINVADTMLPCSESDYKKANPEKDRRLLSLERRVLAGKKASKCKDKEVTFTLKLLFRKISFSLFVAMDIVP